ncbi:MAG: porin [Paracoccaceae bacterium]
MKKVLLATSALVLTAGVAAAEVSVSAKTRMGVVYDGEDAAYSSRVRVIFSGEGETDGGLTFGFEVRNDQSGVGNTANGDSTVWLKGAFGKLVMGDTGNAADILVGQVSGVGYTGLGDYNEIGWLGKDVTGAYYEYAAGNLTFGLGLGQTIDTNLNAADDDFASVAVKYAAGDYSVALGYEDNATDDELSLSGSAAFDPVTVKAKIVDRDSAADMAIALSVDYAVNSATTVTAFATQNQDFADNDTFGIGASYDLGGGASLLGGIVDNGTDTIADLGVQLNF